MQNQKSKPSADMPPEVRRLRAFINGANDTQAADLRFVCMSMSNAQFVYDTMAPVSGSRQLSAANLRLNRQSRFQRRISYLVHLPWRVVNDLWIFTSKPQWDQYLTPVQMEILYGPET